MNFAEIIRMALAALGENKLRSVLTMIAIVVGVFAVISASTAVRVLDVYFKETLTIMGGNVISISRFPAIRVGNDPELWNRKHITFRTYEELSKRATMVSSFSPRETFLVDKVLFEEEETDPNVRVIGTNEFYMTNNAFEVEFGRNFSSDDILDARSYCLVGADVRKELFPDRTPLGKRLKIDGQYYTVIGIAEAKGSTFGSSQDNFVLVPYTKMLNIYGGTNRDIIIQARASSMVTIQPAIDELTGLLRTIRKVPPGKENDFDIATNNSLQTAFEGFTGVLGIFGAVVGGIALFGAGIGVMNIMLVSVTERTREIGIRKAIGATRRAIIQQFLLESIIVCQIGGMIGLVIGILGGNLLALNMESSFVFPWLETILGIVGITLIGLIFGVFPAVKASRLDPIESLRYE